MCKRIEEKPKVRASVKVSGGLKSGDKVTGTVTVATAIAPIAVATQNEFDALVKAQKEWRAKNTRTVRCFSDTGEYRKAKKGEWISTDEGKWIEQVSSNSGTAAQYKILKMEEKVEQI